MSYDPSLPDERVNVPKTSLLVEAATLLAGFTLVVGLFGAVLAFSIEYTITWLPSGVEEVVFHRVWDEVDIADDSPHQAALAALFARIVEDEPELAGRFRVGVMDSEDPNALALPGGMILFTSALLDGVESENELVFVIGHELGHYQNRDHLRGLGQGLAWAFVSTALGLQGDAAGLLARFSAEVTQRSFSRGQELEADLRGLELLARHYGHAGGTQRVFDGLLAGPDDAGAEAHASVTRYLDSHPPHPARLAALRAAIAERGIDATGPLTPWPPPPVD